MIQHIYFPCHILSMEKKRGDFSPLLPHSFSTCKGVCWLPYLQIVLGVLFGVHLLRVLRGRGEEFGQLLQFGLGEEVGHWKPHLRGQHTHSNGRVKEPTVLFPKLNIEHSSLKIKDLLKAYFKVDDKSTFVKRILVMRHPFV